MIAYLDTSAVLRVVLGESGAFADWSGLEYALTSQLTRNEALRTLDRRRVTSALSDDAMARAGETLHDLLSRVIIVPLSAAIIARAAEPFPTTVGTLDAFHLTTALVWREATTEAPTLFTHDAQLARCARACGLATFGVAAS